MSFSSDDLQKVAHLARLSLEGAELDALTQDFSNILSLIEEMNQVNTDQVAPLANALDATQRLRADEVSEENLRDAFQAIAPETTAGLYLVPKVLEDVAPEDL